MWFEQIEGLAKLVWWGVGGCTSAMEAFKGEVGWQFGREGGPRWAQEQPRRAKIARTVFPDTRALD